MKADISDLVARLRDEIAPDDTELRESLRVNGWLNELPAIADETGVILVGNRRMRIAKELGIGFVIKPVTFGTGTDADIERVKLATASNIGGAPMTPKDRKRFAEHLYGLKWTMQAIGEALGVSKKTISLDLGELLPGETIKPAKTATNPKGAGRPKAAPKPPKPEKKPSGRPPTRTNTLRDAVREHEAATGSLPTRDELKTAVGGSSNATADLAIGAEKAWQKGYQAGLDAAAANPELLGATFGAKYERAMKNVDRIVAERIEAGVRIGVEDGVKRVVDKYWLPEEKLRIMRLEGLANRKTPFTYDEYRKLLAALHPDKPEGDDRVAAFQMVKERGPILRPIQKEEEPPPFRIRTHEEFLAEKTRRAAEAKKAKGTKGESQDAPASW